MKLRVLINDKIRSTFFSNKYLLADVIADLRKAVNTVFDTPYIKILEIVRVN